MTPDPTNLADALAQVLALPRTEQVSALGRMRAALDAQPARADAREEWNTRFGPASLFDAWTRTSVMQGLYARNAVVVREVLARPGWRAVEIGGGDGSLWARALRPDDEGELVVVDPEPEVHARVAERLPRGVTLRSIQARVEDATLPGADLLVCSLTLHHVAGWDQAQRARHGLPGTGKREVLEAIREALLARGGRGILNEADIYCDLVLPPGDPLLADRLMDSYVRRCGRAILDDIDQRADADPGLRRRWLAVLRRWCVDQVDRAACSLVERDVYELDVPRWLELLDQAGLQVTARAFTDRYGLFCQYLFEPAR